MAVLKALNAEFEHYDVFVVIWTSRVHYQIYRYQLKEGKGGTVKQACTEIDYSFIIKGFMDDNAMNAIGRTVVTEDNIDDFVNVGQTGKSFTPVSGRK